MALIFTLKNGGVYEGNCVNDVLEGQGKMILPDGKIYVGKFRSNKALESGGWSNIRRIKKFARKVPFLKSSFCKFIESSSLKYDFSC